MAAGSGNGPGQVAGRVIGWQGGMAGRVVRA